MMYLRLVKALRPMGPRTCSFCVLMPISAPRPNSPPSVKPERAFPRPSTIHRAGVAKRQLLDNNGRYYLIYRGATREGKRTVVIWRETAGWTEEDYNATVTLWPSTNLPRVRTLSMSTAIRSSPVLRRWKVCSRQKCLQAWRDRYGRSTLQEG